MAKRMPGPWKSRAIRYGFRVTSLRVMDVAVYFDIGITSNFHERENNAAMLLHP